MKKNQTMNETDTDMQQWRDGKISTQELEKRQAITPVYLFLHCVHWLV
jgi:hypothetical protein